MTTTTDDSVLSNLGELFRMETNRRVEEATAAERERAAAEALEAEAARRLEEEREAARAAALQEAETRRLADSEATQTRIERLRAELDQVQIQREEMRLRVAAMSTPQATPRRSWVAPSLATLSLVAALFAVFIAWPRPGIPAAAPAPAPIAAVVEAPAPIAAPTETAAPEAPVEAAPAPAAQVAQATPTRTPRPRRPRVERPAQDNLSRSLDFGDSDEVLSNDFLNDHAR